MPIFRTINKDILFVHIPKAGGTSVEKFFHANQFAVLFIDHAGTKNQYMSSLNNLTKCSPQHMHGDLLKSYFDLSKFSSIFMMVRHPLDRIVSEYNYRMKIAKVEKKKSVEINTWINETIQAYSSDPYIHDNHLRPQWHFLLDNCKIFKLEDSMNSKWVESVEKYCNIKFSIREVKVFFSSGLPTRDIGSKLSRATFDLIYKFYEKDFEVFKYQKSLT